MSLTRGMLKGMSLTDEQIAGIIEAHTNTVNALKDERDKFKEDASKLKDVQKELEELKKDTSSDEWKSKYEKEHSDFESYKSEQEVKAKKQAIEKAYRSLLRDAKVSEKRLDSIIKVADLSKIELDNDGNIVDSDKLTESIKSEWSDFIESTSVGGANTVNPPANAGGKNIMTKEQILGIKDPIARQKAISENGELFGI